MLFPNRAFVLDISGRASVGARGNVLSGYGDTQLVFIVTRGACVFSENRCVLELADNDSITIVNLRAESAVVSGNVINGSQALTGLRISAELATVLGNITAPTRIILNGAPLPDPWAPLNVF